MDNNKHWDIGDDEGGFCGPGDEPNDPKELKEHNDRMDRLRNRTDEEADFGRQ